MEIIFVNDLDFNKISLYKQLTANKTFKTHKKQEQVDKIVLFETIYCNKN